MDFEHKPVLFNECIGYLSIKPDGILVDATFGRGGHSSGMLASLTTGRLICFDRDIEAKRQSEAFFKDKRTSFVHSDFRNLDSGLDMLGIDKIDGILFDLGVSSPQLDDPERGFSYMREAPLDMRMNTSDTLTAGEIVNEWPEDEIRRILYEYGEERFAARIAGNIAKVRRLGPVETTLELVEIIKASLPAASLREKQHPAKRSFQGLRIAVNDELNAVKEAVEKAIERLREGGRICVISFHSLEDRIVKSVFKEKAQGCDCPPDFPVCVCGKAPELKIITKKPVIPSAGEEKLNPRARSAKLRAAEKTMGYSQG